MLLKQTKIIAHLPVEGTLLLAQFVEDSARQREEAKCNLFW